MKQLGVFVLAGLISLAFTTKEPVTNNPDLLFNTNLEITVRNDLGNLVEGAKVTIYERQNDYMKEENPVKEPQLTDEDGEVKFKKLDPIAYYVDVTKGDMTNTGKGTKTQELTKNRNNKVTIVIREE